MSDGKFTKGNPGKPHGAVAKTTKLVKQVFADVFTELQDDKTANLAAWGKKNPTEFYKLAAKLIPIQISGDPENPLSFTLKGALGFEDDQTTPEV